jgi:hypothetical protein
MITHILRVDSYLCKYKDEDCIFATNPSKSGATTNLEVPGHDIP